MKKLFLLVGSFFILCAPIPFSEAVVDRVVAVVNQEIITLSEIEKWMNPMDEQAVAGDRLEKRERVQTLRREVLNKLIDEKLIDQEVKRSGMKVSNKEVEATLDEIKRRNRVTQEEFEKALGAEGLTLESYKRQIEKSLLRRRLISGAVKLETKGGERELREFYQKNIDRYRVNETFRPAHILFVIPKGATQEDVRGVRKKCEAVLKKVRGGDDFGELALLYSQDASSRSRGDLGFFKKGELLPAFEREALRLKAGEVSGVVRTEFGFHIIKLLDRKGVDPLPFEEVKAKVQADYYDVEMDKAFKQYLSTLREKSIIEIKL